METNMQTNETKPTLLTRLYESPQTIRTVNKNYLEHLRTYVSQNERFEPHHSSQLTFLPLSKDHFPLQRKFWLEDLQMYPKDVIDNILNVVRNRAKFNPVGKRAKIGHLEHKFDHIWTMKVAERCKVLFLQDSDNNSIFYYLRYFHNYEVENQNPYSVYINALNDYQTRWVSLPEVFTKYDNYDQNLLM